MKTELYFLRSTEQKIVTDMLHYARRIDATGKTLLDFPQLGIYDAFYGFTSKDLGLYALCDNQLAGAAWIRRLHSDHGSDAYVNDDTPVLNIAVLPSFRRKGIGSMMLNQLFSEAGVLYDAISMRVVQGDVSKSFVSSHGFGAIGSSVGNSIIDGVQTITMLKKLETKPLTRPSDGYDPRRWMD